MNNLNKTITINILTAMGNTKLTWVGLLKEVKNSHPEVKSVIGVRPALMQDHTTIVAKLHNGEKVIVKMNRIEEAA